MSKFKIGDRVKSIAEVGSIKLVGACGTIIGINGDDIQVCFDKYVGGHSCIGLCKYGYGWFCKEHMIELVDRNNQSIHIEVDGTTTIAILKEGKNVVKRAEAKLSTNDTYDFKTGVEIAFNRLFDVEPTKQVKEVKRKAKVGEWVRIVEERAVPLNEDGTRCYKNGDILKIIAPESEDDEYVARFDSGTTDIGDNCVLLDEEYVVLENYIQQQKTYTQAEFNAAIKAERERIYEEMKKIFE